MNIYYKKQKWKLGLLFLAVIIGFSSLWVTNTLVSSLAHEERKKMELWAEATREIADMESEVTDFTFYLKVIHNNETVPVIVTDQYGNIIDHRNLHPGRSDNAEYLRRQIEQMQKNNDPIRVEFYDNESLLIYYNDSRILVWLLYYPYIQLLVIVVYLVLAYYAFSYSRRAEQNQVWVGMSRETAHQLGTPTSSLIAWLELLKEKNSDPEMIAELEKDINRLEKITDRFSKIGSRPVLQNTDIKNVIENAIEYLRARSPGTVDFKTNFDSRTPLIAPLNVPLFDWVIENVCKNALDAIEGKGMITLNLINRDRTIILDVSDNGRGIPRGRFKTVFKPGYTTRRKGWGLGLSLSKRIIEEYHGGKISVHNSVLNGGTTIRIILKREPV